MPLSPQTDLMDEATALNATPGSGETADSRSDETSIQVNMCCGRRAAPCCQDKYHYKLAISSIICGLSCIGIVALINSVQASRETDPHRAEHFSRRARKFGIISIAVWLAILVCTPILLALVSYLLTLID